MSKSYIIQGEAITLRIPPLVNQWDEEDFEASGAQGAVEEGLKDLEIDGSNEVKEIFPWEEYRQGPTRLFSESTDFFVYENTK